MGGQLASTWRSTQRLSAYLLTQSWFDGSATFDVLLNVIPQPGGSVATMPGQTWYAQLWYRDNVSGTSRSRFSDAIELSFRQDRAVRSLAERWHVRQILR